MPMRNLLPLAAEANCDLSTRILDLYFAWLDLRHPDLDSNERHALLTVALGCLGGACYETLSPSGKYLAQDALASSGYTCPIGAPPPSPLLPSDPSLN